MRLRTFSAGLAAALIATASALVPAKAQTPAFFPASTTLDTTAYSLRMAGGDRIATSGTLARVAAVNTATQGGFPFNEADPTSRAKAYGFASCPKTVAVAAGDNVADALAAASIKDLPGYRVGSTSFNTANAVLLLTASARDGATDLSSETVSTLEALRDSCGAGSFDAIVFGSSGAVPSKAETTLDAIADRVARVSGATRYDTARNVARGLSEAGLPTVTVHTSSTASTQLPNAVFLAEGVTGADALSAGPFAAFRNVPVLLTTTSALPDETRDALAALDPSNIIVLGGTGAVANEVVEAAKAAAGGASATRIQGGDRYATSIQIARQLYRLFEPANSATSSSGAAHANQAFGFARSEGSGADHRGFPDALASAFFLDTFSGAATTPRRQAGPIERNDDTVADGKATYVAIGGVKSPQPAPLLLSAQGELPTNVAAYLQNMYPDSAAIKTADRPAGVNDGGFGFFFGGTGAISRAAELSAANLLAGRTYGEANRTDLNPALDSARVFYTAADFTGFTSTEGGGVDAEGALAAGDKVCILRRAATGGQWLSLSDADGFIAAGRVDYQNGSPFPADESRFQCVDASAAKADKLAASVVSLSGRRTAGRDLDWSDPKTRISTEGEGSGTRTSGSGDPTTEVRPAPLGSPSTSTQTFTGTAAMTIRGVSYSAVDFTLNLTYLRSDAGGTSTENPDRLVFTGSITLSFDNTTLNATLEGEAASAANASPASPLKLVGMSVVSGRRAAFLATVTKTGDAFTVSGLRLDGQA